MPWISMLSIYPLSNKAVAFEIVFVSSARNQTVLLGTTLAKKLLPALLVTLNMPE